MVTSIVAGGDGPADWVIAIATSVAAVVSVVAMVTSLVAARNSKRDAGKAADALYKMATTGQQQFELAQHQADDALKDEARNVTVIKDAFKNREGVAVFNGNPSSTIRDLRVDFRSGPEGTEFDPRIVVHSAKGTNTEQAPWMLATLGPHQKTTERGVFFKENGPDRADALVELTRIRFKDSRNTWWQIVGNGDPVQIVPVQ